MSDRLTWEVRQNLKFETTNTWDRICEFSQSAHKILEINEDYQCDDIWDLSLYSPPLPAVGPSIRILPYLPVSHHHHNHHYYAVSRSNIHLSYIVTPCSSTKIGHHYLRNVGFTTWKCLRRHFFLICSYQFRYVRFCVNEYYNFTNVLTTFI